MKRQNELIKGASIICMMGCCMGIILGSTINTTRTVEEELSESNNAAAEIVYIEIPYVYYEDELERETRRIAYNDYMEKLTDENIESWWYGYQIMTAGWEDKPEQLTDIYTEEDLRFLYKCVETEVYDGDFLSKVNVANVIINRLESGDWGDSFKEIVTSPNQFAYGRDLVTQQTIEACNFAFEIKDTTEGALYFHSGSYTPSFNGACYIFTDYCGHHFYK